MEKSTQDGHTSAQTIGTVRVVLETCVKLATLGPHNNNNNNNTQLQSLLGDPGVARSANPNSH